MGELQKRTLERDYLNLETHGSINKDGVSDV